MHSLMIIGGMSRVHDDIAEWYWCPSRVITEAIKHTALQLFSASLLTLLWDQAYIGSHLSCIMCLCKLSIDQLLKSFFLFAQVCPFLLLWSVVHTKEFPCTANEISYLMYTGQIVGNSISCPALHCNYTICPWSSPVPRPHPAFSHLQYREVFEGMRLYGGWRCISRVCLIPRLSCARAWERGYSRVSLLSVRIG